MSNTFKQLQVQSFTLAGAGSSIADQTIVLSSMLTIDGVAITMTDLGDKGFFTIEAGNGAQEEAGTFTGITQNVNGTATLTGVKHQLFEDPYTETAGLTKSHAGGTSLILSNTAGFYQNFLRLGESNTVVDVLTFTNPNYPQMDTATPPPTSDGQFATKKYVDDIAISGAPKATDSVYGIAKLSSAAAVPTAPVVLNNEEVAATSGANKVVRANASGKIDTGFISDGTSSGLEVGAGTGTQVKIKAVGGLVRDTNGLSVDNGTTSGKVAVFNANNMLPGIAVIAVSDNLKTSADTERFGTTNAYVKVKEIIYKESSPSSMGVRIKFDLACNTGGVGAIAYGRIYVNGVAVGTEQSVNNSTTYVTKSEDLTIADGDLVQLYTKGDTAAADHNSKVRNFRLYYDKTLVLATNTVSTN